MHAGYRSSSARLSELVLSSLGQPKPRQGPVGSSLDRPLGVHGEGSARLKIPSAILAVFAAIGAWLNTLRGQASRRRYVARPSILDALVR